MPEEKTPPPQRERFAAAIGRSYGFLEPIHDHYRAADAVLKEIYGHDEDKEQDNG